MTALEAVLFMLAVLAALAFVFWLVNHFDRN